MHVSSFVPISSFLGTFNWHPASSTVQAKLPAPPVTTNLTFSRLLPSIAQLKACARDGIHSSLIDMGLSCYGTELGSIGQCPTPGSTSAFKPLTGEEVATKTTSRCDSPPCAANSKSPGYQNITIYLKSSPISSPFSYPSLVTTSPPHLTEVLGRRSRDLTR